MIPTKSKILPKQTKHSYYNLLPPIPHTLCISRKIKEGEAHPLVSSSQADGWRGSPIS